MLDYGRIIREARREKGLSRYELSRMAGVTVRAIAAVERGERGGRHETVQKLLQALGLKIVVKQDVSDDSGADKSQMLG